MSRKPRTPGACGALLSEPRRGAPDRSRVGGSAGSCIPTCGGCGRGKGGGASARRLRCGRSSCPSGGRSLRACGGEGGRGRDGCGVEAGGEGGGAPSLGRAVGRVLGRNASPAGGAPEGARRRRGG